MMDTAGIAKTAARIALGAAGALILCSTSMAGPEFSSEDTIVITARVAWEDATADMVHFSGGFELNANDWYLKSDSAVLTGDLDRPETVVLEGAPALAYFLRIRAGQEQPERIEGSASRIEYLRELNLLKLSGNAILKRKDDRLSSDEIEYNIDTDLYRAGGNSGVRIELIPDDKRE